MSGSDFLYPFIEADERDAGALLADLAASAEAKSALSAELLASTLDRLDDRLDVVATLVAERAGAGGRIFAFGNGGSATDATGLVALLRRPPWGRPLPARALVAEPAVLTALGNDVGFELTFARQIIAHGRAGDVAVGLSTSGNSANLLIAFAEARRQGMLTVGLAGYDGGQMAASEDVQHCLVVAADSVHRIQESQAGVCFELWRRIQGCLAPAAAAP